MPIGPSSLPHAFVGRRLTDYASLGRNQSRCVLSRVVEGRRSLVVQVDLNILFSGYFYSGFALLAATLFRANFAGVLAASGLGSLGMAPRSTFPSASCIRKSWLEKAAA